jgi:hypothetical protein
MTIYAGTLLRMTKEAAGIGPTREMREWFDKRTGEHLARVRKYCKKIHDYDPKRFSSLIQRGKDHDQSKFGAVELDPYIYITWMYKCKNDGKKFDCPRGMKKRMHEATEHHVNSNRHHPEYFGRDEKVVSKGERHAPTSTLVKAYKMGDQDIAEMVADWCSVSEEMGNNPRTWAKRTIEEGKGQRWLFSQEQKDLIYEVIGAAWDGHKKKADFAPGLPDPKRFGDVRQIPRDQLLQWVVQRHKAERAGPHYDVRFGTPQTGLYSWATKKELPQPGGKIQLFQQPVHRYGYAGFQGKIPSGYGKGIVRTHDKGSILVQEATPDKIKFIVAHRGTPEYFVMVRTGGPKKGTSRTERTQGGSWLLVNTTPVKAPKFVGLAEKDMSKLRYRTVPAADVEKLFEQGNIMESKIDGASMLYRLFGDHIEATSYRVSKTGRPIIHTHRLFGPGGAKVKIPSELVGTVLRGEAYGVRKGQAIPEQELGGILNAAVSESLEKQKRQNVQMRSMLFDVAGAADRPRAERVAKLRQVLQYLPKDKFHLPETAETPEAKRELWQRIVGGKHPLTREGAVFWPETGAPTKVKKLKESDVWIRKIFPGEKGLKGVGAGGFEYSLTPEGPIVGKVGTGFSTESRKRMLADPEGWMGRMARIRSMEQYPSGAHRAPAFLALHEDYPSKAAGLVDIMKARRAKAGCECRSGL